MRALTSSEMNMVTGGQLSPELCEGLLVTIDQMMAQFYASGCGEVRPGDPNYIPCSALASQIQIVIDQYNANCL